MRLALLGVACLLLGCRARAVPATAPVHIAAAERGCFALSYSDTLAAKGLAATVHVTGYRLSADTGLWFVASERDGRAIHIGDSSVVLGRWRPLAGDSALIEWRRAGRTEVAMRFRLEGVRDGSVIRFTVLGAPVASFSVHATSSLACYPYQL